MAETVATRYAVRVMGVWVRRADALIGNGSLSNAARAVELERARGLQLQHDLAALDLRRPKRLSPADSLSRLPQQADPAR
jgi:hypothetical protein